MSGVTGRVLVALTVLETLHDQRSEVVHIRLQARVWPCLPIQQGAQMLPSP